MPVSLDGCGVHGPGLFWEGMAVVLVVPPGGEKPPRAGCFGFLFSKLLRPNPRWNQVDWMTR